MADLVTLLRSIMAPTSLRVKAKVLSVLLPVTFLIPSTTIPRGVLRWQYPVGNRKWEL